MSSTYPTSLDAFSTAHADGTNEIIHASSVNDLADAVNKIETELGTLPKGASADVKARIAATETVANAAVPKSTVTTAGDLIYGTGSAAVSRLAAGSAGQTLVTGAAPSWAYPPGYEFDYSQVTTASTTATATTEATANTIVTANAVTYDGSTPVVIKFSCVALEGSVASTIHIWLYDGAASIGEIAAYTCSAGSLLTPCLVERRLTPSAAAHTYSIRCSVSAGTATFIAGTGGLGTDMPLYIRTTKV